MSIRFNKIGLIVYLVIVTACVVFASFYGGLFPFVLLYGSLLLLPVSFLYTLLNYHYLFIYQALDGNRVVKGDPHVLTLTFENTGILPVHNMELILHSDRCSCADIKDGDLISLQPQSRKGIKTKVICLYGGTYDIGLKRVGFSDAFGIYSVLFTVPYYCRAIVSPKITDLADAVMDIENITNSTGSKSDIKTEEIPGNEMRDYYPGDPYKTINWKVSARLNRLTVRIPDKLDTRSVTLILEAVNVPEKDWDTDYIRRRDHFLEFAVSAAWFFTKRGLPLNIIYPSGKITEIHIASYEDFLGFYNDVSGGISYRSDDEKERMHRLTQERRQSGYGDETRVIITEDFWPGEDFCFIAD